MRMSVGVSGREALVLIAAALLGACAFPPLGAWPLSLVSIALFLYVLRDRGQQEARPMGLLYGFVYGLGTMYWLFNLFGVFAITLVAIMAGYFGLLATLVGLSKGYTVFWRALLVGVFAAGVEWFRGDAWYLRFPWYTAPHALAQSPAWISLVSWIGTFGLSFVIWTIAALGAFGRPWYWLAFLSLPACSLLLPSLGSPDRSALLVQVEAPHPVEPVLSQIQYERVDLVVLPEYVFPFGIDTALANKNGPVPLAQRLSTTVVFGTVEGTYGQPGFQNVAAVLNAEGDLVGTFPKQRPVPLMVDGLPGQRRPIFPVEGGHLGIGLCYDFDASAVAGFLVRSGATVLVAPTGDLMPWGEVQHVNHELLVRLRAVENDRWVLRATSSGRTEAVNPHGVPTGDYLDIAEVGFVKVVFEHRSGIRPGGQAHVLGPVGAAGSACFLVWCLWQSRRRFYSFNRGLS